MPWSFWLAASTASPSFSAAAVYAWAISLHPWRQIRLPCGFPSQLVKRPGDGRCLRRGRRPGSRLQPEPRCRHRRSATNLAASRDVSPTSTRVRPRKLALLRDLGGLPGLERRSCRLPDAFDGIVRRPHARASTLRELCDEGSGRVELRRYLPELDAQLCLDDAIARRHYPAPRSMPNIFASCSGVWTLPPTRTPAVGAVFFDGTLPPIAVMTTSRNWRRCDVGGWMVGPVVHEVVNLPCVHLVNHSRPNAEPRHDRGVNFSPIYGAGASPGSVSFLPVVTSRHAWRTSVYSRWSPFFEQPLDGGIRGRSPEDDGDELDHAVGVLRELRRLHLPLDFAQARPDEELASPDRDLLSLGPFTFPPAPWLRHRDDVERRDRVGCRLEVDGGLEPLVVARRGLPA